MYFRGLKPKKTNFIRIHVRVKWNANKNHREENKLLTISCHTFQHR